MVAATATATELVTVTVMMEEETAAEMVGETVVEETAEVSEMAMGTGMETGTEMGIQGPTTEVRKEGVVATESMAAQSPMTLRTGVVKAEKRERLY